MDVLIAHGSEASRRRLAQTLTGPGVGLVEAGQGDVAFDVLTAADAPALALIDWDLPVCDGPELCRLVRACSAAGRPYIILLAGSGHHLAEGLDAGADDCVRLPADADELRARLDVGRRFAALPWERVTEEARADAAEPARPRGAVCCPSSTRSACRTTRASAATTATVRAGRLSWPRCSSSSDSQGRGGAGLLALRRARSSATAAICSAEVRRGARTVW